MDAALLRLRLNLASRQVVRFNPNHAPPGAGGGQFTSGPAQGGQAKQAKGSRAQRKAKLLSAARHDRAEAAALRTQLRGLEKQLHAQAAAAHQAAKAAGSNPPTGQAGTAAHHRAQAAKHRAAVTHKHGFARHHRAASAHHHKAAGLAQRISTLRTRIKTLLAAAVQAEAQARKL